MRALLSADGAVVGGVCCLADITDAARMRAELEARASVDALTGCMNRSAVMSALEAMLADESTTDGDGLAAVFIDLDDFKSVNDQFGHAVGDLYLAAVGGRLQHVVRGDDVVGRLGGDEFLLVCTSIRNDEEARSLGDRVAATITSPITIGGVSLTPTASVGVAWTTIRRGIDADALIAESDAAMYVAKHARDGRPVVINAPS
jgi:diguanylate cyclase (GGDEF)-like protein